MTPIQPAPWSDQRPLASPQRISVTQGEFRVVDNPEVVLTTILGSCVAACMRDPVAGVGGMNHFLLAEASGFQKDSELVRYGAYAMELLINGLLSRGARRERLEVKLFGGAKLFDGLQDVGDSNAAFAERFIRDEGMNLVGSSLRGRLARRIEFWPVSGRVRHRFVDEQPPVEAPTPAPARAPQDSGALELF
jgi:chemotaxis protein CheD